MYMFLYFVIAILQIVNGGPLPPNYIHEPSSSFTESGQYRGDITSSAAILDDEEITESKLHNP